MMMMMMMMVMVILSHHLNPQACYDMTLHQVIVRIVTTVKRVLPEVWVTFASEFATLSASSWDPLPQN